MPIIMTIIMIVTMIMIVIVISGLSHYLSGQEGAGEGLQQRHAKRSHHIQDGPVNE